MGTCNLLLKVTCPPIWKPLLQIRTPSVLFSPTVSRSTRYLASLGAGSQIGPPRSSNGRKLEAERSFLPHAHTRSTNNSLFWYDIQPQFVRTASSVCLTRLFNDLNSPPFHLLHLTTSYISHASLVPIMKMLLAAVVALCFVLMGASLADDAGNKMRLTRTRLQAINDAVFTPRFVREVSYVLLNSPKKTNNFSNYLYSEADPRGPSGTVTVSCKHQMSSPQWFFPISLVWECE